jgi:hypothetical protein
MFDKFVEINFRTKTRKVIEQANQIIGEYEARGFKLTVRQLYYQFVARDWLKNTPQNYERLASIVDDARKAGMIDWAAIIDRTRFLRRIPDFADPQAFMESVKHQYAEDIWRDQDYYPEVWIEKDALLGVIEDVCNELRIPYFACRGYPSSSELYRAAKRLRRKRDQGKWPIVFYLGDHDPSGLHMGTTNAPDLIATFGRTNDIDVKMIALTRDQIDEHDPPPNYAKESDARYNWYTFTTGIEECWELDALDPGVIDALIRSQVSEIVDREKFDARLADEQNNRDILFNTIDNWPDVAKYLKYRFHEDENGLWPETMLEEIRQREEEGKDEE